MKAVILTDVHANLPALQAALNAARAEGYDALYHLGDAIGIGPHPAECVDVLLNLPGATLLRGNHEGWLVDGFPQNGPPMQGQPERNPFTWTNQQIDPALCDVIAAWPFQLEHDLEGVAVRFTHYALDESGRDFKRVIAKPSAVDLDALFDAGDAALVFYGHHHPYSDLQGRASYLNPGSLGCCETALARFYVARFERGAAHIEHRSIPYDDSAVLRDYQQRDMPGWQAMQRMFHGNRFAE